MAKEAVQKKPRPTLNKLLLYIALLLLPLITIGQDGKTVEWEKEKDYLKYQKKKDYKGPEQWYGSYPSSMKEEDQYGSNNLSSPNNSGIQYSPQQIQRDRQKRYQGYDQGGGSGDLPFDPEVERPDPLEMPDMDAPDVDIPDIDIDPPTISPVVWKVLLFIIIAVVLLIIAYQIIKNRRPSNQKVVVDVENDWNPEVISKTELELKLEKAIEKGDYRECVRIYFTFILKELISKGWIVWKKEKTNFHYVLEMHRKPNSMQFNECVRIYDLIWYGQYDIEEEVFEMLQPTLKQYYKSLDPKDE